MSHKTNIDRGTLGPREADIQRARQARVAAIEADIRRLRLLRVRLGQFDRVYESPPPVVPDEPLYVGDEPAREEEF